jgi:uncharacterized protein
MVAALALGIATVMNPWSAVRQKPDTTTMGVPGFALAVTAAGLQTPAATLPELTQPVNDFAHVIDDSNAAALDGMIRSLRTRAAMWWWSPRCDHRPYGDIREYANKLFENHGRGIGDKGKDNGLLILLAVNERKVWVEVGYTLEQWVTDGFAGETSRLYMVPQFRDGDYGGGLRNGAARIITRIAEGRNVVLQGVPRVTQPQTGTPIPISGLILLFIAILVLSRIGGGPRRSGVRRWGASPWSGWSSGVGPFGGGGGGGGGFGGGFGGFGGGSSGGGGGGASW